VEGRTRLALGGVATVTASIAVVCAVAMTTSIALADVVGAPVGGRAVVVPASDRSTPTASASPTVVHPQPRAEAPETVPAPEPEDVAAPPATQTPVASAPAPRTSAPQSSADEPSGAVEGTLVAEVENSGSWDAVYRWAEARGWSPERIAAWVERLESKLADSRSAQTKSKDDTSGNRLAPLLPPETGDTSGRDLSGSTPGSKREQSRVPPD
jgi:hypothetical protein